MIVIGITGGSGVGKTTALRVLEGLGAKALDCDAMYHEMLESCGELLEDIKGSFPDAFVNGKFERKRLGSIVFSDGDKLKKLNSITHKYITKQVRDRIGAYKRDGGSLYAIDAVALIESGLDQMCNAVVGVIAPEEVRLKRIMKREGIDYEYARSRIGRQQPDGFFIDNCDYILKNGGDCSDAFEKKAEELFIKIIQEVPNERE